MLHEYRKKTTIKAEQFMGTNKQINDYHICWDIGRRHHHRKRWWLPTKEGNMKLQNGDWIATGIDGEHWAIADSIFRRTYERCD